MLKYTVEHNELIIQAYFNAFDNLCRAYPFIPVSPEVFGGNLDFTVYNFYYMADAKHNLDKGVVWTEPYFDPAGRGWIVSAIAPIYNNEFLEGVTGVDVTLDQMSEKILSEHDKNGSSALLIDSNGLIIAMNETSEKLLDLAPLKTETAIAESDILMPKERNLFDLLSLQDETNFKMKGVLKDFEINGIRYIITTNKVNETGWYFVVIQNQNDFENDIQLLKSDVLKRVIITIIIVMLIILLVTSVYLTKARAFSKRISKPIIDLSQQAKSFALDSMKINRQGTTGIKEIDTLGDEFYLMAKKINDRTNQLIESQIDKRKAEDAVEQHIIEASTDTLTKVYNRRKLDDALDNELHRAQRYRAQFTLFILDIDYFKEINDEYGHATGDDVLIDVAQIIQDNVRATDIVARWGGDEFVVLAVETNERRGLAVAEKIRKSVSEYHKNNLNITASIGLAEVNIDLDNARTMFLKADKALYEAKNRGRNCVVAYHEIGDEHDK